MATDQQRPRRRTSNATIDAYKRRAYDRIEIKVHKGERDALQAAAAAAGMSTAAYIIWAINAAAGQQIITPLERNPYI